MMKPKTIASLLLIGGLSAFDAAAHELRPAYLELRETAPESFDALWKVPAAGEGRRLALYVRLPEGCTNLTEPHGVFAANAYMERWRVQCTGGLDGGTILIEGLAATLTDVLVRMERGDGTTQVARLTPATPSFRVEASPGWCQVARTYLVLGVEHILTGVDHLLFVLALILLVKDWKRLVGTITAFTAAHSVTLAAATLGWVHVPGPPVEACIALSIMLVAAELVPTNDRSSLTARRPWLVAFTFGLLHGFGFAGALNEVGLPQNAIPLALFFFNAGVELGQLVFVVAVLTFIRLLSRLLATGSWSFKTLPNRLELLSPYAIGSIAAYWFIKRIVAF